MNIPFEAGAIQIRTASFVGVDGLNEFHIMLQPNWGGDFALQLDRLSEAYSHALKSLGLAEESAVLRRFFCSDPANQQAILEAHPLADIEAPCAISFVGQAPLPRGKVAMWAYHVTSSNEELLKKRTGESVELHRGELTHYWTTNSVCPSGEGSYTQTQGIFEDYIHFLKKRDMRLDLNVVRTWLYARDVDSTYKGLVDARRELFIEQGLTPETHYIASTGIEGRSAQTEVKVSMDAYAVAGLRAEQLRFLQAPKNLGPTIMYGVSFERATATRYCDRQHIFISGTASIDPAGVILNEGDVMGQLGRVLLNIEALLADASASLDSVASFIVYLRDPDDAERVNAVLEKRFPDTPLVVVWGPVCRPGWLIEIEAIAVTAYTDPTLPVY
ncbi:MAG: Rid family hydrolase [Opitutaceae bacterium]